MIRPATPEEFPQLLDIQVRCIRDLTATYGPYENRVYIGENDRIAGFVSWSQNKPEHVAAIECLYTLKEHRRNGIGKLLLAEAERLISDGMTITVRSTLNARPFYEQQGYLYKGDTVSRAGFKIALLEKAARIE